MRWLLLMMMCAGCMSQAARLNEEGIELARANRQEEALAKFHAAAEADPGAVAPYANLARSYLLLQRPQEALSPAQKAVELNGAVEYKLLLVQTYFWLQRDQDARQLIDSLLADNADNPMLFMALGDIALASRQWDTAIARYQEVVRLSPNADRAYVQIGRASLWQEMERVHKAGDMPLPHFDHPRTMMARMGNMMASGGMALDRARTAFRRAIYINPDNIEAYIMLGILAFQRTDYEEAGLEWEEALRIEPKSTFLHMALGLNAQQKKDFATAESLFLKAGELSPQQNEPVLLRIFLRVVQQQYAQAIALFLQERDQRASLEQDLLAALAFEKQAHVPWLIGLLEQKERQPAEFAARALAHISGRPFTLEAQAWKKWWNEQLKNSSEKQP